MSAPLSNALAPSQEYARSLYTLAAPATPLPALTADCTADVCIVGGGLTGLGAALNLAKRGVRVVLLEQSRLGWGASGRNGGQVHIGLRREQPWLEARLGDSEARALWSLALEARTYLDFLIETYAIDCEFRPGLLHADHKRRYTADTQASVAHLRERYDHASVRFVACEEVRDMVKSNAYFSGSFDSLGGHLHPLKYVLGLARAAQSHGARCHEGSEVVALARSGSSWQVRTRAATVRAETVVLAGNGYMQGLNGEVESHVMPINNFIAVTEPLGEAGAHALIRDGIAVSDSRFVVNYFRITADHRLLFGGGENYSYRFPANIAEFVRPHMAKIFPQMANAALEYAWGGTLAITPSRMPFVREIGTRLFNASGFSGLGVVLAPYCGKILADAIAGDRLNFDRLARVPVPRFPGGTALRRPTLIAAMLWYALRDRL